MSNISSNFSTRMLVLHYKATAEQYANHKIWREALSKAVTNLFGAPFCDYNPSCYFSVPAVCDFIEIDAAISREFSKYPVLKGMRFRLQLRDKMIVI